MKPGDLGYMDVEYCTSQAAKIKRFSHFWFRAKVNGMENLPDRNFIAAGNHSGGTLMPDALVWLSQYHTSNPKTQLLSLSNAAMFEFYPKRIAESLAKMGAIRAETRLALKALQQGYSLQVYPGGDFDACRPFKKRNKITFAGNIAYAKLAIKTQTPIVPVVCHGGHSGLIIVSDGAKLAKRLNLAERCGLNVLPFSLCLPWGIWLGPLPGYLPWPSKITVEVLPAIEAKGSAESLDRQVRTQLQARLNMLAQKR